MSQEHKFVKGNIRVEFSNLEDSEKPDPSSKWHGIWALGCFIQRTIVFGGREMVVWSHWFTRPTKLMLDLPPDKIKITGEKLLALIEGGPLPKENDFQTHFVDVDLYKNFEAIINNNA
jgi:hypothetical protein